MTPTFFWYDYETTDLDWYRARPVQVAGIRTDESLEREGKLGELYCQPAPDHLPRIGSVLTHRVSPVHARDRGIREFEFAKKVHKQLHAEGTCTVGFNATTFDHRITHHLFFRNLFDPYRWHWKDSSTSKWDIIELCRAAYALRRDILLWPYDDEGYAAFKLHKLALENSIRSEYSHRAVSGQDPHSAADDVRLTLDLARLLKGASKNLWDYSRSCQSVEHVVRSIRTTFLIVNTTVLRQRGAATIAGFLGQDPNDKNRNYAFDLSYNPAEFFDANAESLLTYKPKSSADNRDPRRHVPILRFRANASPYVMEFDLSNPMSEARQGLLDGLQLAPLDELQRRFSALDSNTKFKTRVVELNKPSYPERACPEENLYGLDVDRSDRAQLTRIRKSIGRPNWWKNERHFRAKWLPGMVLRFRARNFPETLSDKEAEDWRDYCRQRLLREKVEDGLTEFERYERDLEIERGVDHDPKVRMCLDECESYGSELRGALTAMSSSDFREWLTDQVR